MNNQVHTQIVSFIWSIADDCLRDVYVRGKYRDVILPMTVIRRLDAMLEGTIENVRNTKKLLDEAKVDNQWPALCNAAGQPFCNASPFLLKDLTSRASKQKLKTDFETYLDGFSPNVQEILEKFKFRNQIATMVDADILGSVIEKFVSSDINLSPNPVYKDDEKTILKHPGLDNHGMGTIFEELIRKFNEENNEEAGEHWTPRDVVELMADLIFIPIADQIKDATFGKRFLQVTDSTMVVGVDIGSQIHYARAFDNRGRELTKRIFSFHNDLEGFNSFNLWAETLKTENKKTAVLIGCEPTGHYWFAFAKYVNDHQKRLVMVNPFSVKKIKELDDNSPKKTDSKDPKTIAKLVVDGRYSIPYMPEGIYAEIRDLVYSREPIWII